MTFRAGLVCVALLFCGCHHDALPGGPGGTVGPGGGSDDGGTGSTGAGDPGGGLNPAQRCAAAKDSASCNALSGCDDIVCDDPCGGSGSSFYYCVPVGDPGDIRCPGCINLPCSKVSTATFCDKHPGCHSLFSGDVKCNSPACDNHFVRCEDGAAASCLAPPLDTCPPFAATCVAGDTFAYDSNRCIVGCVHETACDM